MEVDNQYYMLIVKHSSEKLLFLTQIKLFCLPQLAKGKLLLLSETMNWDDTLRAETLQCNYVDFNYEVFSYLLCTFSVRSISSLACSVDLMLHLWYILLGSFKDWSLISPLWLWVSGSTLRFRKPDSQETDFVSAASHGCYGNHNSKLTDFSLLVVHHIQDHWILTVPWSSFNTKESKEEIRCTCLFIKALVRITH